MPHYLLAGENFYFRYQILELTPFKTSDEIIEGDVCAPSLFPKSDSHILVSRTRNWVTCEQYIVETYQTPRGFLLMVENGGKFIITQGREGIYKQGQREELSKLDRDIILGPVIVLSLALRDIWSIHASAAMYRQSMIAFLGESGRGKSTLAAYLDNFGWQRVADDILPVTLEETGVQAWPHFPQLKLPADNQPGLNFPERLPLDKICLLEKADADAAPELQRLPPNQAVRVLIGHTAGSRLFSPDLLGEHLEFCARAAERIPVYRLIYPHRKDVLPEVKELLESIC